MRRPRLPRRSPATCWWSARARPACRRRATSRGPAPMSSWPTSGCMPAASSSSRWRPRRLAERRHLDRQFRDGAALHEAALQAGVRILNETTVWAAFSADRSRRHRRRPLDPVPAQAAGAGDRRLRAVAAGAGLDPARRDDGRRAADAGALLSRGAGRAHRDRGQRPALPADRGGAARRRRQRRGGAGIGVAPERRPACPSSCRPAGPTPVAAGQRPRAGLAAEAAAALAPSRDAPAGRRSRAPGRGGRSRASMPTSWRWATASPRRASSRARWAADITSCRAATARWRR